MADERGRGPGGSGTSPGQRPGGFLGSLKEALVAASRDDPTSQKTVAKGEPVVAALPAPAGEAANPADGAELKPRKDETAMSAADAAREARAIKTVQAGLSRPVDADAPPTTRVVRDAIKETETPAKTQLVRGKPEVKRGEFEQGDPVVGWLVVVGGPGLGAYRPIFEGNNTVGRAPNQRVPIDFGDDGISSEEQAYIRYDSSERSFLFVPNLAKKNTVSINNKRPTAAVELQQMDVITIGRTQLVFVPFCGAEFDWSELMDKGR